MLLVIRVVTICDCILPICYRFLLNGWRVPEKLGAVSCVPGEASAEGVVFCESGYGLCALVCIGVPAGWCDDLACVYDCGEERFMTDFLQWCINAWASLISWLGSQVVFSGATLLGLLLAFIVIGCVVRSFVLKGA